MYSDVWTYKFIHGNNFFKPVLLFSQSIDSSIGEVRLSTIFPSISIHYRVLVTLKATFPKLMSSTGLDVKNPDIPSQPKIMLA